MRLRTVARIAAMKYLYELDMRRGAGCEEPSEYVKHAGIPSAYACYSLRIIEGYLKESKAIDSEIEEAASNWPVSRMAAVDRSILRVAAFEITRSGDVPAKVAINEAVELAKKYSTAKSGAFVNGVLDKIFSNMRRACDVRVHKEGAPEDSQDSDV